MVMSLIKEYVNMQVKLMYRLVLNLKLYFLIVSK